MQSLVSWSRVFLDQETLVVFNTDESSSVAGVHVTHPDRVMFAEQDVTKQITALMEQAVKDNDYLAQSFLQWFIDEQLEEVVKMDRLLSVIKQSGEKNLLMVEAYLVHIEKVG